MIESFAHQGVLINECQVQGETREDHVVPADANAIQVASDRWLIVYGTRGFRGVKNDRSIIYQLRADSPAGELIKEGVLARYRDNWDPLRQGQKLIKQCSHPVAFGVPDGARIEGNPLWHANLFGVLWHVSPRQLDEQAHRLQPLSIETDETIDHVCWVQIALSTSRDDIEFLQPVMQLRERGSKRGGGFCRHGEARMMRQSLSQPVPSNRGATQWLLACDLGGATVVVRFEYDLQKGVYEWAETSPMLGDLNRFCLSEATLAPWRDEWIIATRTDQRDPAMAWFRTDDPFDEFVPAAEESSGVVPSGPISLYGCTDGVLRLFTGQPTLSAESLPRVSLSMWEIDPRADFEATKRRRVHDAMDPGDGFSEEDQPVVDNARLLPHAGGSVGRLLYRIRPGVMRVGAAGDAEAAMVEACGIYHADVIYDRDYPPMWQFD